MLIVPPPLVLLPLVLLVLLVLPPLSVLLLLPLQPPHTVSCSRCFPLLLHPLLPNWMHQDYGHPILTEPFDILIARVHIYRNLTVRNSVRVISIVFSLNVGVFVDVHLIPANNRIAAFLPPRIYYWQIYFARYSPYSYLLPV
ncbi:hypothetical protein BDF22DRAFT_682986 [Syncephalis plumigaleata]|nr:hypothetical protein BDF22DRAFT_682986 [Syncephalis plumigaleata]